MTVYLVFNSGWNWYNIQVTFVLHASADTNAAHYFNDAVCTPTSRSSSLLCHAAYLT